MYRSPITPENFQSAWNYSCKKCRQAKKRTLVRKIAVPVSQLLFFLAFLLLTYGIAYDGFPGLIRSFLSKIPYTAEIWLPFSALLLDSAPGYEQQVIRMVLFLYGVPLAAALLLWLLSLLLYHPRKPVLSADPELHSSDLLSAARQAWQYRTPKHVSTVPFFSVFFAFILVGSCVAFMLYYKNDPTVFRYLQAGMAQASFYFVLSCLIVFVSYMILNLPLRLMVSLLYRCRVPERLLKDADCYHQQQLRAVSPALKEEPNAQPVEMDTDVPETGLDGE